MHPQLPLDFEFESSFTFDTYWSGASALAFEVVSKLAVGESQDQQVYLWGPRQSGKTHLLSAACQRASQNGFRIAYLPARMIESSESLRGYDAIDLVCIDDLQALPKQADAELALFNLINELRNQRGRLLLAASCVQSELGIQLPDLYTRLCAGASFALNAVAAEQLHAVLAFRAQRMGFELPVEVLDYLLNRYSRDLDSMLDRLRKIDRASMQAKRKITIPFVREVFSSDDTP